MNHHQIKCILDEAHNKFNCKTFIENDPICIPHQFYIKEDIEISGFLTAMLAWGNRASIIKNATILMQKLQMKPFDFITKSNSNDFKSLISFYYRTFQADDCLFFIESLKNIYLNHGGLEQVFCNGYNTDKSIRSAIVHFREVFLKTEHLPRSEKHVSNPLANSACKKINMYLRWMVRKDNRGVDFGIWNKIPPSALLCPLDVHSGNSARKFTIIKRKQNDWKAVTELTDVLKTFDPIDPIKYDFALFGLGVSKKSYLCYK